MTMNGSSCCVYTAGGAIWTGDSRPSGTHRMGSERTGTLARRHTLVCPVLGVQYWEGYTAGIASDGNSRRPFNHNTFKGELARISQAMAMAMAAGDSKWC